MPNCNADTLVKRHMKDNDIRKVARIMIHAAPGMKSEFDKVLKQVHPAMTFESWMNCSR